MATKSTTDTLYQKFEAELPEYVEAAARAIYGALHTFLRHDSIPNPAGGPPLPWVSEIRIPVAKETNPKTGKIYTNVEAAWFDKPGIDDIAAELASRWCQPPELLGQYDKYAEGGIYWCINPITPVYLENYGSTTRAPEDRHRPRRRRRSPILATNRRRRNPQRHHHRRTPQRRVQHRRGKGQHSPTH